MISNINGQHERGEEMIILNSVKDTIGLDNSLVGNKLQAI